ncbi:MAG: hypothetical protein IJW20_02680 [Clostridia bacterium]|nr:hypothetical protein [Clostridia bacterium]
MKRAIRRFVSTLTGPKKYIFFAVLALICIVSICIGIYTQFFYKYSDTDPLMLGINIGSKKTAEEIDILKADFNNLFTNSIIINSENVRVDRIESSKDLVYTGYNLLNEDENFYTVNAQIPILNIDTEQAKKINAEIKTEFYDTANNVMRRTEGNTVYSVTYASFVNEDVLSLVVKSSLKEAGKAEKVTIKTYCYSLPEKRILSLEDVLNYSDILTVKGLTLESIQTTINDEIKKAYNNAKIIAADYGTLYERDLESEIYKVENTTNFFLTQDGYIYLVYAYGNNDYTNEMDIIIF